VVAEAQRADLNAARRPWWDGRVLPVARRETATRRQGRRDLVLLVDDSSVAREIYGEYLRHHGYDLITATDGMTGIDVAIKTKPDLIVMDLAMPRMNGVSAAHYLKHDPRTKRIPIILLTAYAFRAIAEGALQMGADVFLTKPCLHEDLAHYVRTLIEKQRGGGAAA
jgi:two-component system cell cycle response regulator DivK